MKLISYVRLLSIILAIIAITMLFPFGVALYFHETVSVPAFLWPMVLCIVFAVVMTLVDRKNKIRLTTRGAFGFVAASWVVACILGTVPYLLTGTIKSFTDAFFESCSGFSTTGFSIFEDVESLPKSINVWRTLTHWLGGMGIIALTVALMPLLGVGGFQLIKAETTGPEKGKITPKITETSKILWFFYVGLTVLEAILLMVISKLGFIDAVCHAFSTMATGGFSTKNDSIGGFHSASVEWICIVFMFLAGVNFSLYYKIFTGKIKEIWENSEFKIYCAIIAFSVLGIVIFVLSYYHNFADSIRNAFFHVLSFLTTTGFSSTFFPKWAPLAQLILFSMYFIGGCSGSTGGGFKVVRWIILDRQMKTEIKQMLHPHGVFTLQLNGEVCRKEITLTVAGFLFLYFLLVLITSVVAALAGSDIFSSFTVGLTIVGNVGCGFGDIMPGSNFGFFPAFAKWWFSFAMLAGRLELYTMIIFLYPSFWKK